MRSLRWVYIDMTNVFKKGNLGTETDMHRGKTKKHREMANKHRKICSKLFIIREMQEVKIRESHLTPISIAHHY